MVWNAGLDSQDAEMTLLPSAPGGRGVEDFGVAGLLGAKQMMSPLCIPMAICFPFGDHVTNGHNTN